MRFPVRPLPFVFALLAFLLIAEPVFAQYFGRNKVQYQQFDFQKFDTPNFEVYYYPEQEDAIRDIARMSERWYNRHSQSFLRQFTEQKPLIFYANDTDFQQTNVIGGQIGQGVGGVTESLKERVVMPLTGSYAETDRILGHELVHSFQYDIALRNAERGFSLRRLPLWLVEGMAEYLSSGREDSHTAMWIRDAVLRDDLPTAEEMTREQRRYFPYRYGQSYMAYVGGTYGDPAVTNLFKLGGRVGVDSAFVYALGISADSLSNDWAQAQRETYEPLMEGRDHPTETGNLILGDETYEERELNVSPAISPDGQYVAFMSQRGLFTINLYIADAETGEVLQELRGTTRDPHFDALRFIDSAGSWSPDGRQFAFVTYVQGQNEIAIIDVESGRVTERKRVQGVGAIQNPSWSPDGRQIAFSGIEGGLSNLYSLSLDSDNVRQLTNDRYSALQPTWSPDGQTIAYTTDRGENGTDFETLQYGKNRIGLIDVESRDINTLRPLDTEVHFYNPQFAPDGNSIYFVSDFEGFKDVFRYTIDEEQVYRITNTQTGISGISNFSPAMTVASQSGKMAFSVFQNSGYSIMTMETDELEGELIETVEPAPAVAGLLPPVHAVGEGLVANYLRDYTSGLPDFLTYETTRYQPRLTLDYIAPPSVGIGVQAGGLYGTRGGLAGGVGFFFSDMLGHRNLSVAAQANGTFKDIGGQVAYINMERRFNYGIITSHVPQLFGSARPVSLTGQTIDGYLIQRQRIFNTQAAGLMSYPFTETRRLDLSIGATRVGFDVEAEFYPLQGQPQRIDDDFSTPDPLYLVDTDLAYVGDFSFFGFTSPVQGGRHRISVSPRFGTFSYTRGLIDFRRYFFSDPFTFAFRAMHVGNYGAGERERIDPTAPPGEQQLASLRQSITEEYLGSPYRQGFLRGYSFNSLDECRARGQRSCPEAERLFGTRIGLASAELRIPLLGTEQFGLINFPYVPTEITFFTDAGIAWRAGEPPLLQFERDREELLRIDSDGSVPRYPLVSVGTSARFNLLGAIVFEVFYAYPFQRPDNSGHFGLQLVPGW